MIAEIHAIPYFKLVRRVNHLCLFISKSGLGLCLHCVFWLLLLLLVGSGGQFFETWSEHVPMVPLRHFSLGRDNQLLGRLGCLPHVGLILAVAGLRAVAWGAVWCKVILDDGVDHRACFVNREQDRLFGVGCG